MDIYAEQQLKDLIDKYTENWDEKIRRHLLKKLKVEWDRIERFVDTDISNKKVFAMCSKCKNPIYYNHDIYVLDTETQEVYHVYCSED